MLKLLALISVLHTTSMLHCIYLSTWHCELYHISSDTAFRIQCTCRKGQSEFQWNIFARQQPRSSALSTLQFYKNMNVLIRGKHEDITRINLQVYLPGQTWRQFPHKPTAALSEDNTRIILPKFCRPGQTWRPYLHKSTKVLSSWDTCNLTCFVLFSPIISICFSVSGVGILIFTLLWYISADVLGFKHLLWNIPHLSFKFKRYSDILP